MMKKSKLKYYAKSHKYKIGRKELTSVTTFVKKFFNPFDKKVAKYVAKKRRREGETKLTAYVVRREWKAKAELVKIMLL